MSRRSTRNQHKRGIHGDVSSDAQKNLAKQKALRAERLKELQAAYKGDDDVVTDDAGKNQAKMTSINCYREAAELPSTLKPGMCYIDETHEAVIIPFQGMPLPFHISTIRNCQYYEDASDEKPKRSLRFTFQVPGAQTNTDMVLPEGASHSYFFKEMVMRYDKDNYLQEIAKQVSDLQKRLKARVTMAPIAPIQQIQLNRGPQKVLLRSIMSKYIGAPTRRPIGTLEAHINGVRYSGSGSRDLIDINYTNIKHCIFQPCKSDLTTYLHFHLKNPIMINSKRQKDIQFYKEIGQLIDDLESRRRRTRDPDEIAEEAKELRMKQLTNSEFKKFVEDMYGFAQKFDVKIEVPMRKLAFRGVPKNENVELMPTARTLIHLSTSPSFIVSLNEIEVVALERVVHGLRNFDMVIIFKDYSRKPEVVNSCEMSSIDLIKRWLTESDIIWYESKVSLYWPKILKTLRADPKGFFAQGGFGAFMADGDAENASEHSDGSDDDEDGNFMDDGDSSEEDDYSTEDSSVADSDDDEVISGGKKEKKKKKEKEKGSGSESAESGSSGYSSEDESVPDEDDDAPDWDEHEKTLKDEETKKRKQTLESNTHAKRAKM